MQLDQRSPGLGKKQNTGCLPVETVNQLQEFPLGMLCAQALYYAKAYAASTMYCHAGGLVEYNQHFILKQDFERERARPDHLLSGQEVVSGPDWRNTHDITQLNMMTGADAFAVKPHLPTSQQLIDVGFRYSLKPLEQEIIYALPAAIFIYDFVYRGKQGKIFA